MFIRDGRIERVQLDEGSSHEIYIRERCGADEPTVDNVADVSITKDGFEMFLRLAGGYADNAEKGKDADSFFGCAPEGDEATERFFGDYGVRNEEVAKPVEVFKQDGLDVGGGYATEELEKKNYKSASVAFDIV